MSEKVLQYHHPENHQFSLTHVTDESDRHESRLATLADDESLRIRSVTETIGDTTAYLIYTNTAPDDPQPDFETEDELRQWLRTNFDRENLPIVLAVVRAYRGILKEEEEAGNELELYKQMQLEKIPEIVDRVEWGQSVPAVATDLLSQFILAHPMPNTNHRTGISLLERYLTSVATDFTMPPAGETDEWYPWAVDYIHDSKRILTLRRKTPLFRYAATIGYQAVQRKEGVTIDFDEVDLKRSDPFAYHSNQHHARTRDFVDELLEQANATGLQNKTDDGKRVFVDRLRADQ